MPDGYLKAVSQILETGLIDAPKKVVTRSMKIVDRDNLQLPRIKPPSQTFQLLFMKIMEEE